MSILNLLMHFYKRNIKFVESDICSKKKFEHFYLQVSKNFEYVQCCLFSIVSTHSF